MRNSTFTLCIVFVLCFYICLSFIFDGYPPIGAHVKRPYWHVDANVSDVIPLVEVKSSDALTVSDKVTDISDQLEDLTVDLMLMHVDMELRDGL